MAGFYDFFIDIFGFWETVAFLVALPFVALYLFWYLIFKYTGKDEPKE